MRTTNIFFFLVLLISSLSIAAQSIQTLRGTIKDADSESPIVGATIQILDEAQVIGGITDIYGDFKISAVPLGRRSILIRSIGYEEQVIPNVLFTAAKEIVLNIGMLESVESLQEVVITATKNNGEILNEMALISARSFSVEETLRYAGSFNDPARMVSGFAGVSASAEGDNSIVVRGNSPRGILWRLEGIEIPNPNHFADEGSTGGPINALNSNMLDNSEFYSGAFAPEFGNALSGVFDIRFKKGNNEKREYTGSASVLGVDFTAEGPFKEGYRGSYIANYRYSSLQLLDELGIVDFNGVPKYQDASFNVNLPIGSNQQLSIFGLGGISGIVGEESFANGDPGYRGIFDTDLGVIGLTHSYFFNDRTFLKNTVSLSGTMLKAQDEYINDAGEFYTYSVAQNNKRTLRVQSIFNHKWSSKDKLETGIITSLYDFDLNAQTFNAEITKLETVLTDEGTAASLQTFISWKHRFSESVTLISGLHSTIFNFNNSYTIEPRIGLKWEMTSKHSFNTGLGFHSKIGNLSTYLANVSDGNTFNQPNRNLKLPKAAHYVVGYDFQINPNTHFKAELYYQHLYDIPIESSDTSTFSYLNSSESYITNALVNNGTGRNYGMELTLERSFNNGLYYMSTFSLYNSLYTGGDGVERSTAFNGNYIFNLIGGKEFNYGKPNRRKVFFVNTKVSFLGGTPYTPIDLAASQTAKATIYQDQPYSQIGENVFFINLSLGTRKNKGRTTREFKIDFNNITNQNALVNFYYNIATEELEKGTQLPMIPNIVYSIKF